MAKLTQQFDARAVPPSVAQEVIPAGWYTARIEESEWAETAAKNGWMLKFKLVIIGGEHADVVLFDRLNMQNPNAMAMEIAQRTLSAICHATKVFQLDDTAQLHGIPLMVKVSVRAAGKGADGNDYAASNEIKGYKEVESGPSASVGPAPAANFAPPRQAPAQQAPAPAAAPGPGGFAPPGAAPGPGPSPSPAPSHGGSKPPWAK